MKIKIRLRVYSDQMAGLDLGAGKDAGPLVSRLDTYYEDPNLVKGKVRSSFLSLTMTFHLLCRSLYLTKLVQAQLVNFPPEFAAIPCKPLFYDLALYHVAMPR